MFCTKCGKELYPGDRFCAYCGAEVRNHEKPRYEDIVFNPPFKIEAEKKTQEILQAVGEQYEVSVSAVDSGIRRMVDQLEARPTAEWLAFKEKSGFADEKPTTGKLIYAVKNYLQHRKGG